MCESDRLWTGNRPLVSFVFNYLYYSMSNFVKYIAISINVIFPLFIYFFLNPLLLLLYMLIQIKEFFVYPSNTNFTIRSTMCTQRPLVLSVLKPSVHTVSMLLHAVNYCFISSVVLQVPLHNVIF